LEDIIFRKILPIIFVFLIVGIAFSATEAQLKKLERIDEDIESCFGLKPLQSSALELGKIEAYESVGALERILQRCNEFEEDSDSPEIKHACNIARAYAFRSLIHLSGRFKNSNDIIKKYFVVSYPIGLAMSKAGYESMFDLFKDGVSKLNSKFPDIKSHEDLSSLQIRIPEIEFSTKYNSHKKGEVRDEKLIQGMIASAYVMEFTRDKQAIPVCDEMLKHPGSFLWEKYVYRAMARLKISPWTIYSRLKNKLVDNRNKEDDPCLWNLSVPESIVFSIKNISTEAYLILTIWRLKVPLKNKVYVTLPSLKSTSFTARAAAIDCLATSPQALKAMAKYIPRLDDDSRKFLALRLEGETNSVAQRILKNIQNLN